MFAVISFVFRVMERIKFNIAIFFSIDISREKNVLKLFNITPEDLQPHITKKLQRLEYWLDNSSSIEFTTRCRTISSREGQE